MPDIPIVGHFAQACRAEFARTRNELVRTYVKSVLHALSWLVLRPQDALAMLAPELQACVKTADENELNRRFDSVVSGLKPRPYPTPQAIGNSYKIATIEYPEAKDLIPLSLWDLHWVKELNDAGSIDSIRSQLQA